MTKNETRQLLRDSGLRATAPRLAVMRVLSEASRPMSHSEVLKVLGETDWDPATIYRNLVKLRDAGVAHVVSRAEGLDRYALADAHDDHHHPHFVCDDCGRIACLPAELSISMAEDSPWMASVQKAMVQLRGECPECITQQASSS